MLIKGFIISKSNTSHNKLSFIFKIILSLAKTDSTVVLLKGTHCIRSTHQFSTTVLLLITISHNTEFLKLIAMYHPSFIKAFHNIADTTNISFDTVGVLDSTHLAIIEAKSVRSKVLDNTFSFHHQLSSLFEFSATKFSIISGILFIFNGIMRIHKLKRRS